MGIFSSLASNFQEGLQGIKEGVQSAASAVTNAATGVFSKLQNNTPLVPPSAMTNTSSRAAEDTKFYNEAAPIRNAVQGYVADEKQFAKRLAGQAKQAVTNPRQFLADTSAEIKANPEEFKNKITAVAMSMGESPGEPKPAKGEGVFARLSKTADNVGNEIIPPARAAESAPKQYPSIHEGNVVKMVDGKPVSLVDGVETFLHKDENGNWNVSEATTGRNLSGGGFENPNFAVRAARDNIDNVGEDQFKQLLAENKLPQTKAPTAPVVDTLAQEAKKYKTADEFVAAQGTPLYHGSDAASTIQNEGFKFGQTSNRNVGPSTNVDRLGKGIYFADNPNDAARYAKSWDTKDVVQSYVQPGTKIKKFDDYQSWYDFVQARNPKAFKKPELLNDLFSKEGYGGVKVGGDTVVFDPKNIKTQKQLTNIHTTENFPRQKNLAPVDAAIQEKAIQHYVENKDQLIAQYRQKFGNVVNPDDARPFFDGYNGRNAMAVHEPSSQLAKDVYEQLLAENKGSGKNVLILGGGSGSGKGTVLSQFYKPEDYAAIYDTTIANYDSGLKKIKQAEAAGLKPEVVFVIRDAEDAWVNGVMPRAERTGRIVPLDEHVKMHTEIPGNIKKLMTEHPEVQVDIIDNRNGLGKANFTTLDNIKDLAYNKDELRNKLYEQTYQQVNQGYPADLAAAFGNREEGAGGFEPGSAGGGQEGGGQKPPSPVEPPSGPQPEPESDLLNLKHFKITTPEKQIIADTAEATRPRLEAITGKTLSNAEVQRMADQSSKLLTSVVGREQTKSWESALLNTREFIAEQARTGVATKDFIENLAVLKSNATDIGRKLQSFAIDAKAEPPSAMQAIISSVQDAGAKADDILEKAKGVDFNNLKQATKFYREFVKPDATDWLDLIRYNSMLSSPLTHIVNTTSNIANTFLVAPIEKVLTGGLDWIHATATGGERQYFAGESGAYLKGYLASTAKAYERFTDVMAGRKAMTNLDMRNLPLAVGGAKGAFVKLWSFPMQMLDAADQFFTTLTKGGVEAGLNYRAAKGASVKLPEAMAESEAAYRVFRQGLHDANQGKVLDAMDQFTSMIQKARNSQNPIISTISKFTLPFVQTPMNIFKQGIEYSPAGFSTLWGAKNQTEQLAKAIMGTSVFAGAATMLMSNRLSWAAPTDAKNSTMWRQAGKQAYSMKIGDTWVSYQKLPPALAFPFALVASVDDLLKNRKNGDTLTETILSGVAKYGQFLADQSYVKSIGDLMTAFKGGPSAIARVASNYNQQLVPWRALGGWMTRLIDDTQRQVDDQAGFVDKQMQLLMMNIPGLSQYVPARLDEKGNPIKNSYNVANAFSPARLSKEQPDFAKFLNNYDSFTREIKAETDRKAQDRDRVRPVYDEVQKMIEAGDVEGAKAKVDALSEEDYAVYKTIKASEKSKKTITGEVRLYPVVKQVQDLLDNGKEQEARDLVDTLSAEDYRLYRLAKQRMGLTQ